MLLQCFGHFLASNFEYYILNFYLLNENFMFLIRRLVLEGDNLYRSWLVCVCWSWASLLYLRSHTS